jgi:hypothetical protein
MDGQIQKAEFLGPDGLLSYVRAHFLAKNDGGGPEIPDIRRHKMAWFDYFDEDQSGDLSQAEVVRGLIKSFRMSEDLKQVRRLPAGASVLSALPAESLRRRSIFFFFFFFLPSLSAVAVFFV